MPTLRLRTYALVLVALVSVACSADSKRPGETSQRRETAAPSRPKLAVLPQLAGRCYTAILGDWSDEPTRPPLPSVFRLDTIPDPRQDSTNGFRQIVPDWTETDRPRWPAGWRIMGGGAGDADSLELVWSLGRIGVRLTVAAKGDSMRGHARTYGDELSIPASTPRVADVVVVPTSCAKLHLSKAPPTWPEQ